MIELFANIQIQEEIIPLKIIGVYSTIDLSENNRKDYGAELEYEGYKQEIFQLTDGATNRLIIKISQDTYEKLYKELNKDIEEQKQKENEKTE